MKFLAVWLRWWVGAVLAGIAAAVLAGLCETFPLTAISVFEENNYLGYHLFATAVQSLALTIDRWLPEMIGLALLLAAALQAGARGRGKVRPFLRVGLPMLALGAVAIYHFHHYPSHWYMVTTTVKAAATFCWHFLLTPLGLLLPLALLAWIEWRILRARRRTTGPDTAEGKREQAAARRASALRRSLRLLRFPSYAALGLLLVLFIALHAAWGLYRWRAQGALRGKPNIIFIMVDTLRVDHVGCYGYDLPTTPNIDRFAKTSTRFANPISQASWTPWSVNSLFTSQYPDLLFASRLDVLEKLQIDLQGGIAPTYGAPLGFTTLAEVLRDRGYSTSAVVANIWIGANPGNTQGYAYYSDAPAKLMSKTSPDLTRLAIARLQKVKDAPFFMFLSYMDPHFPYDQHPGFTFGESRRDRSVERGLSHTIEKTQLVARRQGLRRYDSEIAYTDDSIGQFLEALKTQGLFDDALIVFFSDHGEEFREHTGLAHGRTVYQELTRVPLIVKLPRQRAGRVVEGSFPLINVVPSLLSYLGYPRDRFDMRGDAVNLAEVLRCSDKPIYLAAESAAQGVIDGQRAYVSNEDKTAWEYYDLATDPLEQHNLLARQPAPAEVKTLKALFEKWDKGNTLREVQFYGTKADHRRLQTLKPDSPAQRATIERLKALGYNVGAH